MKGPTLRDVALLCGLQIGTASLMGAVLALLPIMEGSNGWVGAVGAFLGAQSFVMINERKRPGVVAAPGAAHRLAVWSTVVQVVLGAAVVGLLAIVWFDALARVMTSLGWWLAVVVAISVGLSYAMTRLGLRLGLRNLARLGAAAKKTP